MMRRRVVGYEQGIGSRSLELRAQRKGVCKRKGVYNGAGRFCGG